jgi:hypothetical protein
LLHPRPLQKAESLPLAGFYSGQQPDNLAASVVDYCSGVLKAPNIVQKLKEANRKAETERQKQLAAEERRRRDEDQRNIQQSFQDSKEHLENIISEWSRSTLISEFLAGLENKVSSIPETQRHEILARIKLARELLGNDDPMKFILSWKTPNELYRPRFPENRP